MDVNIHSECIYCGKKKKVSVKGKQIGSYIGIMNAKLNYTCEKCKDDRVKASKKGKVMDYKELYGRIKIFVENKKLVAHLFNRKMGEIYDDGKKRNTVKYVHVYDPDILDGKQILSIYYDKDCVIGNNFDSTPYYEIYYGGEVERFFEGEENKVLQEIENIINRYIDRKNK